MRIARKLFLLTVMALAALALSATTASAQAVEVFDEPNEGEIGDMCEPVVLEPAHVVHGGCHWEVESTHHIPIVVQTTGGPVTLMNCLWHLEGQVGGNGEGFITHAKLTDEDPVSNPPCTRKQCDEGNGGAKKPWPFHIREHLGGAEEIELIFCLETKPDSSPTETMCEVHLPLNDPADHEYMVGTESTYTCENLPPVSFHNVEFIDEAASEEDIEIIH